LILTAEPQLLVFGNLYGIKMSGVGVLIR